MTLEVDLTLEVELPDARAIFSTRRGGVSQEPWESLNLGARIGDDLAAVRANRTRLADAVGVDPSTVAMGRQMHGTDIRDWTGPPDAHEAGFPRPQAKLPEADGHSTTAAGVALLVLVADCLPVGLAGAGRVAMLHCGWRGLAGGMIERALEGFDERPAAAVGPGIGGCCYEVGDGVLDRFADLEGVADGRMLDLRSVAARKLEAGGVSRIEHVDHCTACRPDLFYSHRRDRGLTGRQAGLIVRTA